MQIDLDLSGDVVERQELLDGTTTVSLVGADPLAGWDLDATAAWNIGLAEPAGEGDMTLRRRTDGAEIFATLVSASAEESPNGVSLTLEFAIDGGTLAFESAAGAATAELVVEGDAFHGGWHLRLPG